MSWMGGGVSMNQLATADSLARFLCRQLYEDTDGRLMEWRRPVGEYPLQTAVEYGVAHGWLQFDTRTSSICLTDEGRRQVRRTLS
jgi:hypothetical protein